LQIPELRTGSFFPTLLEPRWRIDRALLAVDQEAYVLGISTRKWTTSWPRWEAAASAAAR
jgi:putative transposase